MNKLLQAESHFAFGENWKSFLSEVDQKKIDRASEGLKALFPDGELEGSRFLDIGSGSGLSALAAYQLGASFLDCVDIDPNSVEATRMLLSKYVPQDRWQARLVSVFDLPEQMTGTPDVVHSWGVLHHTGDMWGAIRAAASLVQPNGLFAVALYRETPLCWLWKVEKAIYTRLPRGAQNVVGAIYKAAYSLALLIRGTSPAKYSQEYLKNRGMSWDHDIHDWLGGYPYESVSPTDMRGFMAKLGFTETRSLLVKPPLFGVFGTGCDQFVFRRQSIP